MVIFTTLWANSADDWWYFSSFFSLKTGFYISYKLSPLDTIYMKCQILFSGIIIKNISKCHLLKNAFPETKYMGKSLLVFYQIQWNSGRFCVFYDCHNSFTMISCIVLWLWISSHIINASIYLSDILNNCFHENIMFGQFFCLPQKSWPEACAGQVNRCNLRIKLDLHQKPRCITYIWNTRLCLQRINFEYWAMFMEQ